MTAGPVPGGPVSPKRALILLLRAWKQPGFPPPPPPSPTAPRTGRTQAEPAATRAREPRPAVGAGSHRAEGQERRLLGSRPATAAVQPRACECAGAGGSSARARCPQFPSGCTCPSSALSPLPGPCTRVPWRRGTPEPRAAGHCTDLLGPPHPTRRQRTKPRGGPFLVGCVTFCPLHPYLRQKGLQMPPLTPRNGRILTCTTTIQALQQNGWFKSGGKHLQNGFTEKQTLQISFKEILLPFFFCNYI